MGVAKTNKIKAHAREIIKESVRLWVEKLRAAVSSFIPMACPTLTSAPTLFNKAREVVIHVRIPTEPTAAMASLPNLPTQAISVRLYAIWMKEVAMIGMANMNSWRRIGPSVRFLIPFIEVCVK